MIQPKQVNNPESLVPGMVIVKEFISKKEEEDIMKVCSG